MRQAITNALVAIPNALTNVASVTVPHNAQGRAYLQFVIARNALAAFQVVARYHGASADRIVASTAGNFTTPTAGGPIAEASGDLTTAAVGTHWLRLQNLQDVESLTIKATSGNAAGSDVTVTGSIV